MAHRARMILTFVIAWMFIGSFISAGLSGVLILLSFITAAALLYWILGASGRNWWVFFTVGLFTAGLFVWFRYGEPTGLDLVLDGLCLAGAVSIGASLWRRYEWHPLRKVRVWVVVLLAFWLSASFVEVVRRDPLAVEVWSSTGNDEGTLPTVSQLQVGVALSGGGYRAAVFHAGTLHGLEHLGIEPSSISTVSGGSIIGTYYWRGGDPEAFRDAVIDGRFNLFRELFLFHNAARLIFPVRIYGTSIELFPWYRFDRLDVQEALIDRLVVQGVPFALSHEAQPNLILNTTDLNQALHIAFMPDGVMVLPPSKNQFPQATQPEGFFVGPDNWELSPTLSLAEIVAASGAFPGAFPTTPVSLKVADGANGWRPLSLSDGGVIDNVGATALLRATATFTDSPGSSLLDSSWRSDIVVVSDAGAIFTARQETSGLAAAARAFDVSHTHVVEGAGQRPDGWIRHWINVTPKLSIRHLALPVSEGDAIVPEERIAVWIQPIAVPEALLKRIVALLPEEQRQRGEAALKAFIAFDPYTRFEAADRQFKRVFPKYQAQLGRDACEQLVQADGLEMDPLWRAACASAELRFIIREGLAQYVDVFGSVPTLKSQLTEDEATALFNLGEALAYIRHYRLARAVKLVNELDQRAPSAVRTSR